MAAGNLRVIAIHKAKPDKAEELRTLLLELIPTTLAEQGCIAYELLQNQADPTEFAFVEEWTDGPSLDAHLDAGHIADAIEQFPDLLATDVSLGRYDQVS